MKPPRDPPTIAALVASAVSLGYLLLTASQPLRLQWGDPWSDVDIMTAGRFFARYGFVATRFTPVIDVEPLTASSYRYVHYPPLGELLNGLLQSVFQTESLTFFRVVAIAISGLSLWFFHRWVAIVWGSRAAGFATVVFATNALWLKYADCIHSHPLHLATGFASLYFMARAVKHGRTRDLWASGIFAFLCFLASYDFYFFLPVGVVLTPALLGEKLRLRPVIAVGAFCVAAFALKCALAMWALGSPAFKADLAFQFFERATSKHSFDYRSSLPKIAAVRMWRFFSPAFFVVLVVLIASLALRKRRHAWMPAPSPLALLLAAAPFVLLMSQLFAEQYHPSLCFLPFAAVGTGVLAASLRPALSVFLLAAPVAWAGWDIVTSPKVFVRDPDLALVREYLEREDKNVYLYSNALFSPTFRHSFNRHLVPLLVGEPSDFKERAGAMFDELGDRPAHYVRFDAIDELTSDCKAQSYMAVAFGRRDWLEDPWSTREAWQARVRERSAAYDALVREVGVLAMRAGSMEVYRIDPVRIHAWRTRARDPQARVVSFGDESSIPFIVRGFRGVEKNPPPGFDWTVSGPRKRMVLTARGVELVPGDGRKTAAMVIDLPGPKKITLVGWSAVDDQRFRVRLNGHLLLDVEMPRAFEAQEMKFAARPRQPGPQMLELEFDRTTPEGVGVALRTLSIDE